MRHCQCVDYEQEREKPTTAVQMQLILVCGLLVLAMTTLAAAHEAAPRSIKSNVLTHVKRSIHGHRHRRQAQPLTPDEKTKIVDHHNALRALEGAADMELLVRYCTYIHSCY